MDCQNDGRCPKDQYCQPHKGCTPCDTICFPGADHDECLYYCSEYWHDLQKEASKLIQKYSHKDGGDFTIILGVVGCLAVLLILAAFICCGCKLWSWYQQIQNEKKKARQETGYVEEGTMPPRDLRKEIDDVTNARPAQPCQNDPDTPRLLPQTTVTSRIPQETTPQPPADHSPPTNESPTTYPKRIHCENVTLTPKNEENTDQTSVKVIEDPDQTSVKVIVDTNMSENPSPVSSTSPPLETNTERRNSNDLTRPSHSNTSAQTSQADPSLPDVHQEGLQRARVIPQVWIRIPTPPNEAETEQAGAYFIPGQASPDPVVTEPFVTEATTDATSKSSINRTKKDVHLYRFDVNQVGHEEASATQLVDNTPQVFGIQVRNNPEEYLQ